MREKVLHNAAECKLCHDVVVSRHVHDYRSCKCGEISVDGGLEYLRRAARDLSNIIDHSIVEVQPISVWLADDLSHNPPKSTLAVRERVKQHLRWGAMIHIQSAISKDMPDLSLAQYDKIREIIYRELVGEK